MSNWLELAIMAFIALGIGAAIWRGGATNPVGTAGLQKNLSNVVSQVDGLKEKVTRLDKTAATVADLDALRSSLNQSLDRLDSDLKEHREEVMNKLDTVERIEERVSANATLARALPDKIDMLIARDGERQAAQAGLASDIKAMGRQLDRIMDQIVEKGMRS